MSERPFIEPGFDDSLDRPLADNECKHGRLPTDPPSGSRQFYTGGGKKSVCRCWDDESSWR